MKCFKCNVAFHTCSNCHLDADEDFAFYSLGVCWGCFKAVNGPERHAELLRKREEAEDTLRNDIKQEIEKL